jgi:ribosomal protein S13
MRADDLETKSVRMPAKVWQEAILLQHDLRLQFQADVVRLIFVEGIKAIRATHPALKQRRKPS